MSQDNLSGEEKRRQLKEQFKKELLLRKEFIQRAKALRQTKRINEALTKMSPTDDTQEWIEKLDKETAFMDAKSEIAMESVQNIEIQDNSDEDLKKIIAEGLVEEMRAAMIAEKQVEKVHEFPLEEEKELEEKDPPTPPRKTLGDL